MSREITSVRSFLDRILAEGKALGQRSEDAAAARLGLGDDAESRRRMRQTALGAGAVAGVAALLLGGRGGRRLAAVGGLGLLGKLAWDAWQKGRDGAGAAGDTPALADLPEEEAARRAETLAWAMFAAARADGHIDDDEQAAIDSALGDLPIGVRAGLTTVMMRPADAAAIAARAGSDRERAEIYAASVAMSGRDHPGEVAWLAGLAAALGLDAARAEAIAAGLDAGT